MELCQIEACRGFSKDYTRVNDRWRCSDCRELVNATTDQALRTASKKRPKRREQISSVVAVYANRDVAGKSSLDERPYPDELHPKARVHNRMRNRV